jgi:hypothetical protein
MADDWDMWDGVGDRGDTLLQNVDNHQDFTRNNPEDHNQNYST